MIKDFDLYVGEPGTGKSYTLTAQALMDKKLGRSVYIMTPTQASKQNLISMFDKLKKEADFGDECLLNELMYHDTHVMESSYQSQEYVYLDEIGQLPSTYFNSLLLNLQSTPEVHLKAFGDIKQLTPPSGNSPVEALLRTNLETKDLWQFVADKCYDDFYFETMTAPKMWQMDTDITVHLLEENHRLQKLGFTSFDDKFFDEIVKQAVYQEDYTETLAEAINDYRLILVATKQRGKEIDDLFSRLLTPPEFMTKAPFIEYNSKTYLNPYHEDYSELQSKFNGVPTLKNPDKLTYSDVKHKFWATVHSTQGITVSKMTFYMGNAPIANGHKSHYSSNLLYTSITRASDSIQLLGLPESFEMMRNIQPETPQQKLQHHVAHSALMKLFDALYNQEGMVPYSFEQINDMYLDIYKKIVPEQSVLRDVSDFNVTTMPYTENELKRKFKDYSPEKAVQKGFKPNYKVLIYDKYISEVKKSNGANRAGKGKVQVWLNGLSEDEFESVKQDVNELSRSQFKAKYNKTNTSVKKALEAVA